MSYPSTSVGILNATISHTLTLQHLLNWWHAEDPLGSSLEERTTAILAPLYLEHLDTHPWCTPQQHLPVQRTGINMEGCIGMTIPTGVFGFTAVPTISLVYCDGIQTATDCAHRLCWNLDEGIGGARIGCSISLNSDSTRRKVMYKGNQVYTCTPGKIKTN